MNARERMWPTWFNAQKLASEYSIETAKNEQEQLKLIRGQIIEHISKRRPLVDRSFQIVLAMDVLSSVQDTIKRELREHGFGNIQMRKEQGNSGGPFYVSLFFNIPPESSTTSAS